MALLGVAVEVSEWVVVVVALHAGWHMNRWRALNSSRKYIYKNRAIEER